MATSGGNTTIGGVRWQRLAGGAVAAVLLLGLFGRESVTETGTMVALVAAAVLATALLALVAARVVVPLCVRCCRALAGGYRWLTPDSAAARLVALALTSFVCVGALYLGVGLLAG
jgi:hypothetical protein